MTIDFFKSPEGEAAYKAIDWPYPETLIDKWYADFQKLTRLTRKEDHKMEIRSMLRYITREGEEYIIHDMTETKYDPIGNRKRFYRPNIGKYPKPVPQYEIEVVPEEGYAKRKKIVNVEYDIAYSIPFTEMNIDKLMKYCDGNTNYTIQKEDYRAGLRIHVNSINDWRKGKAEHLLRFGHIPSSYEEKVFEDEKIGKFLDHPNYDAGRVYR